MQQRICWTVRQKIDVRFEEHMRYMRSNNSTSAYAKHILDNIHEHGSKEDTVKLLKKCQKGKHTDCLEALHMRTFHQKKYWLPENS